MTPLAPLIVFVQMYPQPACWHDGRILHSGLSAGALIQFPSMFRVGFTKYLLPSGFSLLPRGNWLEKVLVLRLSQII